MQNEAQKEYQTYTVLKKAFAKTICAVGGLRVKSRLLDRRELQESTPFFVALPSDASMDLYTDNTAAKCILS